MSNESTPAEKSAIANEEQRLDAVRRYDILETAPDCAFDHITALASQLLRMPVALLSIVDRDRVWFKSRHGLHMEQISRDPGLCASCILQEGPWIVNDARTDLRALANPLVAGDFGAQFYLGIPLRTRSGFNLGTLCVLDFAPRQVTETDVANLIQLAAVVMDELELRLVARDARSQYHQELARRGLREDHVRALLRELTHRSKNLLSVVLAIVQQTARRTHLVEDYVVRLASRLRALALTHDLIADEDWKGVTLQDLAARQLAPFIGENASRVKSEGPQLMLSPAAAQNIGLALHELATNAVKYGALSQSQGTIHLTWQLHPPRWHIAWQERDGPQATAPVQKGFGHAVLARVVPEALDGEAELSFDSKGFIWKLDMSAEHVL